MLYEFALTVGIFERFPAAVDREKNLSLVQVLRGLLENGILANLYDGAWWAAVQGKRGEMPTDIYQQTTGLLRQLFDRGLLLPRPKEAGNCPRNDGEWLEEAVASHGRECFRGIIAKKASITGRGACPSCAIGIEDVLLAPLWNERRRSRRVPRTTAGFEAALGPVLASARSVVLIDRYLGLGVHRRALEVLDMLSVVDRCATPAGRRCPLSVVEIHTEDAPEVASADYPRLVVELQRALPRICRLPCQRVFRTWQAKPNGPSLHNRRVVTNQFAISCPWGLEIHDSSGRAPGEDEWMILDDEDRTAIWRDFKTATSPYDLKQDLPW